MSNDGLTGAIMNTSVVGVAIGLFFTYLIAALIVSSINELIAGIFQWRGTYLRKGITVLLSNSADISFGWNGVKDWMRAHFTQVIPPNTLPTSASTPDETAAQQKLHSVLDHPLLRGTPTTLPSYVPACDFSAALLDLLRDGSGYPPFRQVEQTIGKQPDGDAKRILTAFVQDAAGDLDALRARIEKWFDDAMDRLSGIYKRNSQYFLLALGLLAAVVLNIDSVHMATALWSQPDARAKIIAQIQTDLARQDAESPPSLTNDMQELDQLPLPIGRSTGASFFGEPTGRQSSGWTGWNWWTMLGWLVTAVAISLGAPFWFDLLQNIMNLRSSGPPPSGRSTTGS